MSSNTNASATWITYQMSNTSDANAVTYATPHVYQTAIGGECVVCHKNAVHKVGDMWVHPECFYEVKYVLKLAEVEVPFSVLRRMLTKGELEHTVSLMMNDYDAFLARRDRMYEEAMIDFAKNHPISTRAK